MTISPGRRTSSPVGTEKGLNRSRALLVDEEDPGAAGPVLSTVQGDLAKAAAHLDDPRKTLNTRHAALAERARGLAARAEFLTLRNRGREAFRGNQKLRWIILLWEITSLMEKRKSNVSSGFLF